MFNSKYLLPLALISAPCFAEDAEKPFQAEAEFGAILTSGNTKSTAVAGKLDIKQELSAWRTNYVLNALYKEDEMLNLDGEIEDEVTAEKYFLSAQGDYKLNKEHRGLFIFGSYDDDRFSGFEYQSTIAVGYSDRLFQTDQSSFDYSVGPGYAFNETPEIKDELGNIIEPSESNSSLIVRVALNFAHSFSENAKFTQTLASDIATDSDENTKTRAESALTTKISDQFALKASYTVTNNSEPQDGFKATDSQTALTVVYSF